MNNLLKLLISINDLERFKLIKKRSLSIRLTIFRNSG